MSCPDCGQPHSQGAPACPARRVGEVVAGRYRLLRLIGAGGMGAVYEAQHLGLGTRVALKTILNRSAKGGDTFERFRREARSIADLHHPGIVEVRDLGVEESGFPFMALELLEGGSAWDLLDGGPLPVERAVWICAQALDALAVAHARGIVHRDLKPGNLFVAQMPGGGEQVKILDFGLAKVLEADMTVLTRTGHMMGSVPYMSPEQASDAKRVDARTDVYAMGATLFELLTTRLPAEGSSAIEILLRVADGQILRNPSQLRPEVPLWLDAATARALAHDPVARFQSATEMRAALEQGATTASRRSGEATTRGAAATAAGGVPSVARSVPATAPPAVSPPPTTSSAPRVAATTAAPASEPRRRIAPRAAWVVAAAATAVAVVAVFLAVTPAVPIALPAAAPLAAPQPAPLPAQPVRLPSPPRRLPPTWESSDAPEAPGPQAPVAPVSGPVGEQGLPRLAAGVAGAPVEVDQRAPRPAAREDPPAPREPPPVPGLSEIAQTGELSGRESRGGEARAAPEPASADLPPYIPGPAGRDANQPVQPSAIDWEDALEPLSRRVLECTRGSHIMVEVCARGDGRVTRVGMALPDVPAEVETCVRRVVQSAQVIRFRAPRICINYAFP